MRRPETAGGGVASTTGPNQRLSRPVEIRLLQVSSVAITASISLSTCAPVRPETGMTRTPRTAAAADQLVAQRLGRDAFVFDEVPFG